MRKIRTQEEKVAKQLADLVNNVMIDLDEVGIHLATNQPHIAYLRLENVIEAAKEEKDERRTRNFISE
jgi:hypothetical protein